MLRKNNVKSLPRKRDLPAGFPIRTFRRSNAELLVNDLFSGKFFLRINLIIHEAKKIIKLFLKTKGKILLSYKNFSLLEKEDRILQKMLTIRRNNVIIVNRCCKTVKGSKKVDVSKQLLNYISELTGQNSTVTLIAAAVMLIFGFAMLIKGADFFVDGASKAAAKMKVPLIVIGLTIVAFGTSAPEAAISINSAVQGNAGISVGNVIGSNIMNVLLILGISALFASLPVKKTTFRYEIPFVIFITVILGIMGTLGGNIDKLDAILLLVLFALFFAYLILLSKKGNGTADDVPALTEKDTVPKMILFILIGLAAIVLGSDFTVTGATEIAVAFQVDDRIIGLTIVAFGTSLPELVTSVTAARKNQTDIAIGNIIGSNIFNILLVVGLAGVVSPIPIGFSSSFLIDSAIAAVAALLLWLLVFKNKKLSKAGGAVMLGCYAVYFVYLILN